MTPYDQYEARMNDNDWSNMTYQFNDEIQMKIKLYKELRALVIENRKLKTDYESLKMQVRSEFQNVYNCLSHLTENTNTTEDKIEKLAHFQAHMMERFGTDLLENDVFHACKIEPDYNYTYRPTPNQINQFY